MKTRSHLTKIIASFMLLTYCSLYAQQYDTLFIQRNNKGKIEFARFTINPDSDKKISNDTLFLKSMLQTKDEDEFRLKRETTDELGITSKRFQQYYKGIEVENAEYLLHSRNGYIEVMNGDFQVINITTIEPTISEQQALFNALDYVKAEKYKWESTDMEKFIKQHTNDTNATYYPKGDLVIASDYLNEKDPFKLSWRFTISSLRPYNAQIIFVGAIDGKIIKETPLIINANVSCIAQTLYSGTQTITCDSYSSGYRLREIRNTVPGKSVTIKTLNEAGYPSEIDFSNTNTNWTSGSWTNFAQYQSVLDVHWGTEKVIDYFSTLHSRNGIKETGLDIRSFAHCNNFWIGCPSNAFWDGSDNRLIYGAGDGIDFNPFTALDVIAHEIGHGITQYSSSLSYSFPYQESAALNEGFSDIWAICVKNYFGKPQSTLWLLGNEVVRSSTGYNCLRNSQNPKNTLVYNYPTNKYPDTYMKTNWRSDNQPHTNSTILSHWFYIVSQSKNGTNDNGNYYNVNGIGINKAEKIAYRTLCNLQSSANYTAARNVSIQAALDLYGKCSQEVIAVTNAWYAVGVGSSYVAPTNTVNVTGPYNSGTTTIINNANTIDVNNATINSGATVILDACGSVKIYPGTTIQSGATFIVK